MHKYKWNRSCYTSTCILSRFCKYANNEYIFILRKEYYIILSCKTHRIVQLCAYSVYTNNIVHILSTHKQHMCIFLVQLSSEQALHKIKLVVLYSSVDYSLFTSIIGSFIVIVPHLAYYILYTLSPLHYFGKSIQLYMFLSLSLSLSLPSIWWIDWPPFPSARPRVLRVAIPNHDLLAVSELAKQTKENKR